MNYEEAKAVLDVAEIRLRRDITTLQENLLDVLRQKRLLYESEHFYSVEGRANAKKLQADYPQLFPPGMTDDEAHAQMCEILAEYKRT